MKSGNDTIAKSCTADSSSGTDFVLDATIGYIQLSRLFQHIRWHHTVIIAEQTNLVIRGTLSMRVKLKY